VLYRRKNGRVKNVGGGLVFKKWYPEALSLIVSGVNLEELLTLRRKTLFHFIYDV
jgi:hypothetical protein